MSPLRRSRIMIFKGAGCDKKVAHTTFESAVDYLLNKSHGDLGIHIYRCFFGPHWHLGHFERDGFCPGPPAIASVVLEPNDVE